MTVYSTSEIAGLVGIHPNTVRFYEEMGLITPPKRKPNGYRVFTQLQLDQFKLARVAFRAEVLQSGLREKALDIVRLAAAQRFSQLPEAASQYLIMIKEERKRADEALMIAEQLLRKGKDREAGSAVISRKEAAKLLGITVDTLRNWERNGLLELKPLTGGRRMFDQEEVNHLKVIRALRLSGYSLTSIRRMLKAVKRKEDVDVRNVVDTPGENEDLVSVCDHLITSLSALEQDGKIILDVAKELDRKYTV